MGKRAALILAIGYTIVLSVLSFISVSGMPGFGTDYDDKLYHIFAYFALMMIWYLAIGKNTNDRRIGYIALGCISFGIIIEAMQGKLIIDRVGDLLDAVANFIGVAIAIIFIIRREKSLS